MIAIIGVLTILLVTSAILCIWLFVEKDSLVEKNWQLESTARMYRNMYYNLKAVKIDESQWKDMTTAQIIKAIVEEEYSKGTLNLNNLLYHGTISMG